MNNTGKYILGGVALLIVGFLCWYFSNIIGYVLFSAVISFIGQPFVNFYGRIRFRKYKLSNSLKAALTLVTLWLIFILFFVTLIPMVVHEFSSLEAINIDSVVDALRQPLSDVGVFMKRYGLISDSSEIVRYLSHYLNSMINFSNMGNVFGSMAETISSLAVFVFAVTFIAFFFLKDSELFTRIVVALFPNKYEDGIRKSLDSIQTLLVRYFVGIVIEVTGVMILNTLGLSIIGFNFSNALVIGLATGILNIIPYIGPIIGMVLGLSIGIVLNIEMNFFGDILHLVGFMMGIFIFTQVIDNTVFQPLIYGNSVYAHPLEIFLVLLMAGSIAGIVGMILAIPSYTVIRVILREFFSKYRLVKKITNSLNEGEINAHSKDSSPLL